MQNIEYSEASELENAKMKTVMIELRYDGIVDVLKNLEGLFQKPRNIDEILQIWEAHISKNMRYDALNFSINKMFPPWELQGDWTDKIDDKRISLTEEQRKILLRELQNMKKQNEWDNLGDIIGELIVHLQNQNYKRFIATMTESPTLQKYFLNNEWFSSIWFDFYRRKSPRKLLDSQMGNCKVFAWILKMILEMGNIRWNLWIKKVEPVETEDFHVLLEITKKDGSILKYDPMKSLYK